MNAETLPTGPSAKSWRRQEQHRAEIALRAEAILGTFWREDTSDAIRAFEVESWADVLESVSQPEIRMAWATYQRTGPRSQSGRLAKPDAGALWRIIMAERPRPKLVVQPSAEPPREPRVTPDAIRRIMAEVGWRPAPAATTGVAPTDDDSAAAPEGFRPLAHAVQGAAEVRA